MVMILSFTACKKEKTEDKTQNDKEDSSTTNIELPVIGVN